MNENDDQPSAAIPTKRRWRRLKWVLVLMLLLFVGAEMFARFYLGLGDPPLMQTDPAIEYLFQPSHVYHRFGHKLEYNQWSMRSEPFPRHKASPAEVRVLVVGDSVVNGGVLTDDSELATRELEPSLSASLGRTVIVGNISAGSWGPENQLAYLKKFGLFDADVVVFVWSSHDAFDVPTFDPKLSQSSSFPTRTPPLALWDGVGRYLLPRLGLTGGDAQAPNGQATQQPIDSCVNAMRDAIQLAQASGAKVIVLRHFETGELGQAESTGHKAIRECAQAESATLISIDTAFLSANKRGEQVYRDYIHPNAAGQREIASTLAPVIVKVFSATPTSGHVTSP